MEPAQAPSPDQKIRQDFVDKLTAKLNSGKFADSKISLSFVEGIQVDQGKITGHIYNISLQVEKGVSKKNIQEVLELSQHVEISIVTLLHESGINVYYKDVSGQLPGGIKLSGKQFIAHNTISNTDNSAAPVAGMLISGQGFEKTSGNISSKLNLNIIQVKMQGMNPTNFVHKMAIFCDRLPATMVGLTQYADPEKLIISHGGSVKDLYKRFRPS